jgi:hypothetical protein
VLEMLLLMVICATEGEKVDVLLGKTWETACERLAETSILLACSGSEGSKAPMSELNFLYSRTSLEMTFSSRSGVIGIPLSVTAWLTVW